MRPERGDRIEHARHGRCPLISDGVPPPKKIVSTIGPFIALRIAPSIPVRAVIASTQPASSIAVRTWELKSQ